MEKIKSILAKLPHPVRWVLTMVLGFVLLIMGLIMMVTPGPVSYTHLTLPTILRV